VHSMEPWQRARALLEGKWEADMNPDKQWPDPGVMLSQPTHDPDPPTR